MKERSMKVMTAKGRLTKLVSLMVVMAFMFGSIPTVSAASYTIKTCTASADIVSAHGVRATLTETVVVYLYTDGKVHIYSQTVSCKPKDSGSCYVYTPIINNTDGSWSYCECKFSLTTPGGITDYGTAYASIFSGETEASLKYTWN